MFTSIKSINLFFGANSSKYIAAETPSGNAIRKVMVSISAEPTSAPKIPACSDSLESPDTNKVLLNLAKRIVFDGEGASKFVTIKVLRSKTENDAKKIAFSIANSPLVKTAIAGNDPNWGRIIMAIGKTDIDISTKKLSIKLGPIKIIEKGQLLKSYLEDDATVYMKESKKSEISVELNIGKKNFTAYTMDFTKKYIEINADYRS